MNKTDSRRFNLYKLLMEELDYRPANFFSTRLSVSTKTIYDDVEYLNRLMDNVAYIDKIPRKGLILKGTEAAIRNAERKIMQLISPCYLSFSPEERQREIVKRLFLKKEYMTYEQLSEEYVVSVSSIRKDMDEIQAFFRGKPVYLVSDHFGTRIEGEEKAIQHVLKQYIFSLLEHGAMIDSSNRMDVIEELADQLFLPEIKAFVHEVYGGILARAGRPLSDYYKESLYISLLIYVQRISIGCYVTKKKEIFMKNMMYMESYLIAVEIAEAIHHQLGLILEKNDIEFLSGLLFAHDIKPVPDIRKVSSENIATIKQLIWKMSQMLQIDLSTDTHLFDVLTAHVPTMIYRLKLGITLTNPLLDSIKRQYSILFNIVWYLMNDVEETYDIQLNDHDISFLTIHFQVAIEKQIPTQKILIVCEQALATSELIFNKIKHALPATSIIETISLSEFYANDLDEVDLIISSVRIEDSSKSVIYVSPLVTEVEMRQIKEKYEDISQDKSVLKAKMMLKENQISKFLNSDFIFLHKDFKNKDQVLDFFANEAYTRGLVTKAFKQSLYEREVMGETSLYTGVAIPHASSHTLKASFISLITLNQKIQWGSNKVNLIIFVAVTEKDITEIKDVFAALYALVEKKENVSQLVEMTDTSKLLEYMNKKTCV
ncbi:MULTISPECIES: PTS sugar transporter subunit IIA [unclassified Virgibacillus]|uniref:BglG family transcription antiterminator n=1 Tax=unclassified Virgibacillus TaxID=2620237 RepID=UPI0024DE2F6F|nr:PTS sugar transporter subunit IIA [Virgibacillus sp. LDC-1]